MGPTSALPKPPLGLKKNLFMQENFNTTAPASTEALLKMADEGLANIELELKHSQQKKTSVGILKNQVT